MKRIYVKQVYRGKDIPKTVIHKLEKWSAELGHNRVSLGLFTKLNYQHIENSESHVSNKL